ncbi:tankyrase-1-like [Panicum hallii]|uniref:tankyrase-1-like n=1 Tax=Panicum hallii TaxID=206008 RepID=UPI000DF4D243|nr:tankyrase-1-like [Panicum hallii]
MASPAATSDDLSTLGKSSLRPQLDLQPPQVLPENSGSSVDRAVADLLAAAFGGDIPRARKSAKKLAKAGKGVDEAVAAVSDPESKRHGPLHLGAAAGKVDMCKLLIEDFQANVDATDVEGATPLVFAVQGTGSTAVVSLLLSHGADANKADNGGISPLHIAAERGFYEVAELLLSKGADVDPICENGGAPVHIAAKMGHAKVLKLLLQNKADAGVDVNDGSPVTPLTLAADKGLTEFINCLLEAGADANIPNENGTMPIEIAALKGWEECVKLLFPVTTPLLEYADWSTDGIIQHGKTVRLRQAYKIKAEGDAAFRKKDYLLASSRYTLALEMDPDDSTMYAKRSLCFQRMDDKESAMADAKAYRDMRQDLQEPYSEEEGAALKLVEEYCRGIEALMSGLNLGPESGPADKGSSTKAAAVAAAGPPVRRSTRQRKPNTRFSGPEWAT